MMEKAVAMQVSLMIMSRNIGEWICMTGNKSQAFDGGMYLSGQRKSTLLRGALWSLNM